MLGSAACSGSLTTPRPTLKSCDNLQKFETEHSKRFHKIATVGPFSYQPCVDEELECARTDGYRCQTDAYIGTRNVTITGRACMSWAEMENSGGYEQRHLFVPRFGGRHFWAECVALGHAASVKSSVRRLFEAQLIADYHQEWRNRFKWSYSEPRVHVNYCRNPSNEAMGPWCYTDIEGHRDACFQPCPSDG